MRWQINTMNFAVFRQHINFSNVILFFSGLFLIVWGGWLVYKRRDYVFGGGMFLIGVGNLSFAVTNGFTNMSPQGRIIFKFGAFSYILGFLSAAYSMRHLVM